MDKSIALPLTESAKSSISVVVSQVMDSPIIVGFRRELDDLLEKIQIIASIVDSMTAVPDAAVELWLGKTIRIIRSAENVLDVLAYEKLRSVAMRRRRQQHKALAGKIKLVFLPLRRVYLRTKMASCIRKINRDIETVVKEARFIHELRALVPSASSSQPAARNTVNDDQLLQQVRRNVDTSLFVGRDSDVDCVVAMLLCNPAEDSISTNSLSVVAIVGIGGMGKTTLAKQVYENEMVLIHFSQRIWISDLKDFNVEKILNGMVEILGMGNDEHATYETTIRKLKEHLGGKRYLLVLDDVWNTKQHLSDSMRSELERIGGSKDSMILMTTRDVAVAKTMHTSPYLLSGLSEDASWLLFKQIAFANWSHREDVALEEIGMKIVKRCKGVPLAIRSIAGILNRKRNLREWAIIETSELWSIPHHMTGVLPSLKLSYNQLPPMLRKCFSICGVAPKYWSFSSLDLIGRWIALGFIQKSDNENLTMEEIGEGYLRELVNISFLLVFERNELGEATRYTLHDLVYDLARLIAMHEGLYFEASKKESKAVKIQYLTIHSEFGETTSSFPDKKALEHIRSLDIFITLPKGLLVHVKYLRVLFLADLAIKVVPNSIARLKCLKFLALQNNPIEVLPECIMELCDLQSLFLYECNLLLDLPKGLSNLVNLRHLHLSFRLCPIEGMIGQLNQLQTLPPLQLSDEGFQISELGCLHHVKGTLDIKGLELIKRKLDAENAGLSTKPRVKQLRLSWDNDDNYTNHEAVLDGLHPNPNLKLLSIKGYGGEKFPSWLMRMIVPLDRYNGNASTLCNLIKIEFIDCRRCQRLPTMGHLPLLKLIEIRNMENLEEWCESGLETWTCFPSLEVLVIEKCWSLKKVPNNFPILKELIVEGMCKGKPLMKIMSNKSSESNLTKLEIKKVKELTHIPEEVGECTSLQTLIIEDCPNLVSIPNLSGLGSLRELELFRNYGLRGAPEGLESCKSLEKLWINSCLKVETLPELGGLIRLWCLGIMGMRKMIRQPPNWLYNLTSLRVLHIGNYWELKEEFPDIRCLLKITSLEALYVYGWRKLQNLPEQLQRLRGLKTIVFNDFENVEQLPDWLGNLSSLQTLGLIRCKRLKTLPSKEAIKRLRNFTSLEIEDCPLLEQAVHVYGPEYPKIADAYIKVQIFNSSA